MKDKVFEVNAIVTGSGGSAVFATINTPAKNKKAAEEWGMKNFPEATSCKARKIKGK